MGDIADMMVEAEMNGYETDNYMDYYIEGVSLADGPKKKRKAFKHEKRTEKSHPVQCECGRRFAGERSLTAHIASGGCSVRVTKPKST